MSNNLITSSDSVMSLSITSLYTTAQIISGFASDEAFSFPEVELAETSMGVDGVLSAGYVPVPFMQQLSLQADSDSNLIFENWFLAQKSARTILRATGSAIIPSTSRQYKLTRGVLVNYTPAPEGKKVLQPRRFGIRWEALLPSAYASALA